MGSLIIIVHLKQTAKDKGSGSNSAAIARTSSFFEQGKIFLHAREPNPLWAAVYFGSDFMATGHSKGP